MTDYLRQIMGSLSEAKIVADADLPFLLEIEQMIVQKLRDPMTRMQQAGIMPGSPQQVPGGGPQMMQPQQAPMPPSMAGAGGVRGVPTQPGAPNVDELRRLLTNNQ
jgi:hypothetical protein